MKSGFLFGLIVFGFIQLAMLSTAVAEECSPVDLAPAMGPVRNQGDVGWCYANAASDLLSFRYRSELHGQPISAFYTALSFNDVVYNRPFVSKFVPPDLAEGGYISLAMKNSMSNGFCPRLGDDRVVIGVKRLNLKEKLQDALKLKEFYDKRDMAGFHAQLVTIRKTDNFINHIESARVDRILRSTTSANFLKSLADELCHGRKIVPHEPARTWLAVAPPNSALSPALLATIDRQLDRSNPVGVDYYDTFFEGWDVKPDPNKKHASVIVGRAMRGGQCYYKLRNSWGAGCNYANPLFKQGLDCDRGYLWIPKSKYGKYLFAVSYLEPRGQSFVNELLQANFGVVF